MERPKWAYTNSAKLSSTVTEYSKRIFFFLNFEHHWDLFQFMPNDYMYYFYLNKDYKSEYNFKIIYDCLLQKCKHIDTSRIWFILSETQQELFIQSLPVKLQYIHKSDASLSSYNLPNIITTYELSRAIHLLNTDDNIDIDDTVLVESIYSNYVQRNPLTDISSIVFFGASVTAQKGGYVDFIDIPTVYKKGYGGCHIHQAIFLLDDILALRPSICVLEWITSSFVTSEDALKQYIHSIIQKLLRYNIQPFFLYLYKTDIDKSISQIAVYEKIANVYGINSLHVYKVIQDLNIEPICILKDTCHTNYKGSNLYSRIMNTILKKKEIVYPNIHPYEHIYRCSFNSTNEYMMFNDTRYYKINEKLILKPIYGAHTLYALGILYCKTNGMIHINQTQIQTWDKHCYYTRAGFIHISIPFVTDIEISVSQEEVDTSACKYDASFPAEKILWVSEVICLFDSESKYSTITL